MSPLLRMFAWVVLAVWVPATAHCQVEQLAGPGFLSCCVHPDTAPHQDDDCRQDECSVVESGLYRIENQTPFVAPPTPILLPAVSTAQIAVSVPVRRAGPASGLLPGCPVKAWQFCQRAAAPPRAPTPAS